MATLKKAEVREIKNRALDAMSSFKEFQSRPFKYSVWITNVCLGFLGFYVALLLQMKGSDQPIYIYLSILFFAQVLIPIVIGIVVRIKREVVLTYDSIISIIENFQQMLTALEKVVDEGEDTAGKASDLEDSEFKVEMLEQWKKNLPINAIWWQTVLSADQIKSVKSDYLSSVWLLH